MFLQVLSVVFFLSSHVFGCEDISPTACQQFASQNPDMCSYGQCYSSLCQRTCNKCAKLKCYSCGSVDRPEDCQTAIECPSKDHKCISAKSFANNFQEIYSLGCALGDVCNDNNEAFCCTSDLCNNNKNSTQQQTGTPATTMPTGKRDIDQSCRDIHASACKDLVAANSSICESSCAKSLCPFPVALANSVIFVTMFRIRSSAHQHQCANLGSTVMA
uniref:Uncharacterized protein LOC111099807 n=1 Tax=Crassostrea virginica TaxID=6565 RepID=A0A8B8A743_CRAVI|nr:uncharacterized protein LOC111099807 [Crassostrea virginica]